MFCFNFQKIEKQKQKANLVWAHFLFFVFVLFCFNFQKIEKQKQKANLVWAHFLFFVFVLFCFNYQSHKPSYLQSEVHYQDQDDQS
jgi:hypothetical protein